MDEDMTQNNDLVLIYYEDKPLTYARVEEILANSKAHWYQVKLLMLQVPLQMVTWILRDVYIDGAEFTMNGKRMRIEKVIVPQEPQGEEPQEEQEKADTPAKATGNPKVISLADLKKK
jgi:hypothetical protein